MNKPLEFDGERFTPESVREIWYEHMHRYAFAMEFVKDRSVLDAACGEGYGSAMLAAVASSVTGVDASEKAVEHARQRYQNPQLGFTQADCADLPFADDSFDVVVSFETIEHLEAQESMLAEFRRVLRPEGFLLISSPDKAVYSDQQGFDNPHHVRELYADEFRALLGQQFPAVRMLGQKLMFHSAIFPVQENENAARSGYQIQTDHGSGPEQHATPFQAPMYLLAFCAQSVALLPRTDCALWLFDDAQESVYQHYQHEIRKNMHAGGVLAERDQQLAEARQALEEAQQAVKSASSWLKRLGLSRRRD